MARVQVCNGDLLNQPVEVIVNAWNRNIFPWWLLLPSGVSGAIKRSAGLEPFRQLSRMPMIPLGGAVETSAGKLAFKAIIHVAGINLCWRSSERAIRQCVISALDIATKRKYHSIAIPLIGAGTGGMSENDVLRIIRDEAEQSNYDGEVSIVQFQPKSA
jgi:O-acetyl-ADP-ribose deacetylase (regulator of RNase III)